MGDGPSLPISEKYISYMKEERNYQTLINIKNIMSDIIRIRNDAKETEMIETVNKLMDGMLNNIEYIIYLRIAKKHPWTICR